MRPGRAKAVLLFLLPWAFVVFPDRLCSQDQEDSRYWTPHEDWESPTDLKASEAVQKILDDVADRNNVDRPKVTGLEPAERALALARETNDRPGEALALVWRARCLALLGRRAESAAAWAEAGAAWEFLGQRMSQLEALCAQAWFLAKSDPARSDDLIARAIDLAASETGRPQNAAVELMEVAFSFAGSERDFSDQARRLALAALATREAHEAESVGLAETLGTLGLIESRAGNQDLADDYHQRALAIAERLASSHPSFAWAITRFCQVARTEEQRRQAWDFYVLERETVEKKPPEGDFDSSVVWNLMSLAYLLGDRNGELICWKLLLKLIEKGATGVGKEDSTLTTLAGLAMDFGDPEAAKKYALRAVALNEKPQPNFEALENCLVYLGEMALQDGDLAAAEDYFQRAMAAFQKRYPEKEPAYLLNWLGAVAAERGDSGRAEDYFRRAHSEGNLAVLHLQRSDPGETAAYYRQQLAAFRAGKQGGHVEGVNLQGLANYLEGIGEFGEALDIALWREQNLTERLRMTLRTMAERQALNFASGGAGRLDFAFTLLAKHQDWAPPAIPRVWDALIRSRAVVLEEMAARHRSVAGSRDPAVIRLMNRLAIARERLASLVVRGRGTDSPERFQNLLEDARLEMEQAEQAFALRSWVFREEEGKRRVGFEEVNEALPVGSVLVSFVRYARSDLPPRGTPQKSYSAATPYHYLALILQSDPSQAELVPLGPAEEIEAQVAALRREITRQASTPDRAAGRNEAEYRKAGDALRQKIWDPVAAHLEGAERVFVVPDGALHLVSLAALPVGKTQYLIETGPGIHYLTAERDLVQAEPSQKNQGLLAVGAPAFDEPSLFAALAPHKAEPQHVKKVEVASIRTFRGPRSACGSFQSLRFEPLPASVREVSEIKSLWEKSIEFRPAPAGSRLRGVNQLEATGVFALTGAEASEAAFKRQAPGKRILHMATHGFFLGGDCASALESPPSRGIDMPMPVRGENPLLLAGLALAGANHREAARFNEEDGILTAEEIGALDLSGVEWAVLSACDTGLGEVKSGEGVLGLRRAFQVAGVRTVIMSLWPVEDESVRQWMERLYTARFGKGVSTTESVDQAGRGMLFERRAKHLSTHPFYWAGFVAAGDWR